MKAIVTFFFNNIITCFSNRNSGFDKTLLIYTLILNFDMNAVSSYHCFKSYNIYIKFMIDLMRG